MLVDLVQVTTRDGFRLDGAFQAPQGSRAPAIGVDAFCLVHGTGGSFYSSTLLEAFAERLLSLGCAVVRVNTRGHDLVSSAATAQGGRRLGAAYETVEDCRHDLAAWVDWLRQRVGPRVGLLGHSSGAVKCLYAPAREPQLAPVCVVAVSPPRLSYSWFCTSPEGPRFLETYHQAEQHVQEDRPAALLEVKLPLPFLITAAGYLEKYGPDERYNYLRFVAGLNCPMLFLFGGVEIEKNMAFRGAPEELEELKSRYRRVRPDEIENLAPPSRRLDVDCVPEADHFYTGVRKQALDCVERWLRGNLGGPPDPF